MVGFQVAELLPEPVVLLKAVREVSSDCAAAALACPGTKVPVPVVAVAGLGRAADVKRVLDAGFRAHLTKPVALDKLLSTLEEVVGRGAP